MPGSAGMPGSVFDRSFGSCLPQDKRIIIMKIMLFLSYISYDHIPNIRNLDTLASNYPKNMHICKGKNFICTIYNHIFW